MTGGAVGVIVAIYEWHKSVCLCLLGGYIIKNPSLLSLVVLYFMKCVKNYNRAKVYKNPHKCVQKNREI